jgi:hypothetical protein
VGELRCWMDLASRAIDALLRFAWSKAEGELTLVPQMLGGKAGKLGSGQSHRLAQNLTHPLPPNTPHSLLPDLISSRPLHRVPIKVHLGRNLLRAA